MSRGFALSCIPCRPTAAEAEVGAEPAQTRALLTGIVAAEGGGTTPHPLGGGVGWGTRKAGAAGAALGGRR